MGGVLALGDPRPHAHHLPQRPEGDPLTVGGRAALLPVDGRSQTVHVFEELPGQPALADSGETGHRHQSDPLLPHGGVEQLLEKTQFLLPADKGWLGSLRSPDTSALCHHALSPPDRDGLRLAFECEWVKCGEGDRPAGGSHRRLAHQHTARAGSRLQARRGVHEVPGDHPLAGRAHGHRGVAR